MYITDRERLLFAEKYKAGFTVSQNSFGYRATVTFRAHSKNLISISNFTDTRAGAVRNAIDKVIRGKE